MKTLCPCLLAVVLLLLGGCTQKPASMGPGRGPIFETPWVGMYTPGTTHGPTQLSSAHVMLEDTPVYDRWEKAILGPAPLATYSAYTIYTYDAQPIGAPNGTGYRYRYILRQGVEAP